MASFSLSPDGLLDTGAELRGVTRSIERALGELNGYVQKFISANAGGAAEAYQVAQNTWNEGLAQMQMSLAGGAAALDNIREIYKLADGQGAAKFQGHV